jgi:hypothetical protein
VRRACTYAAVERVRAESNEEGSERRNMLAGSREKGTGNMHAARDREMRAKSIEEREERRD